MDDLNRQAGDDQIGVITLMRLMWKWKIVILAGILICALAALVISVLMPHIYEVDMLVENVQIGTNKDGEKVYLGNLQKISNQIRAGAFNQDILRSLSEQRKKALPKRVSFRVSLENNNQFARIAYEGVGVEMGEKILSQLFKRLQEINLVRIGYWKKELDDKIEEKRAKVRETKASIEKEKEKFALEAKTRHLEKEEMLAETKAKKNAKEEQVKQLQKEINNIAVKRKSDISEEMLDLMAEKKKNAATIKNLDKRTSEIRSTIKVIESEMEFLIKIRKELLSKRNETRNMGVVGELSSTIMDGYGKLDKLKQKVLINDGLMLQARLGTQELDNDIERLKKESGVKPSEIEALNDKIAKTRLEIEDLESREKQLNDGLVVASSAEMPDKDLENSISKTEDKVALVTEEVGPLEATKKKAKVLEDFISKAEDKVALIEEEVGILEANKKKVKNIVLLQSPTGAVSPLTPNTRRNVVIGAVAGLFLSLFLSVFLEYVYKKDA